jgi:hypothetical protein
VTSATVTIPSGGFQSAPFKVTSACTQIVWRSTDVGAKNTNIPGSDNTNNGFTIDIKTTLGNGDTHVITPFSGTIDGQPSYTFIDNKCNLSLISDGNVNDWVVKCLCCATGVAFIFNPTTVTTLTSALTQIIIDTSTPPTDKSLTIPDAMSWHGYDLDIAFLGMFSRLIITPASGTIGFKPSITLQGGGQVNLSLRAYAPLTDWIIR